MVGYFCKIYDEADRLGTGYEAETKLYNFLTLWLWVSDSPCIRIQ